MRIIYLMVLGTKQKQSLMKQPKKAWYKTFSSEMYTILKGILTAAVGGMAAYYLGGLLALI